MEIPEWDSERRGEADDEAKDEATGLTLRLAENEVILADLEKGRLFFELIEEKKLQPTIPM